MQPDKANQFIEMVMQYAVDQDAAKRILNGANDAMQGWIQRSEQQREIIDRLLQHLKQHCPEFGQDPHACEYMERYARLGIRHRRPQKVEVPQEFRDKLQALINSTGVDNLCNTPDHLIADIIVMLLQTVAGGEPRG